MIRDHAFDLLNPTTTTPIETRIARAIEDTLASFPEPGALSIEDGRRIIARYTAVLEGNFIYWMTATYLSVRSEEAQAIILENLHEEIRDNHPGMLRKFAVAARAVPTETDSLAIGAALQDVRLFVGQMCAPRLLLMMAFFEGFITKFMPYLAELAARQGSSEMEYTDVHGVVDVVHSRELFRAFHVELADMHEPPTELMEGVEVLRTLIELMGDR